MRECLQGVLAGQSFVAVWLRCRILSYNSSTKFKSLVAHKSLSLGLTLRSLLAACTKTLKSFMPPLSPLRWQEKAMDAMEEEWSPLQFECKAYRTTGTHILSGRSISTKHFPLVSIHKRKHEQKLQNRKHIRVWNCTTKNYLQG